MCYKKKIYNFEKLPIVFHVRETLCKVRCKIGEVIILRKTLSNCNNNKQQLFLLILHCTSAKFQNLQTISRLKMNFNSA